MLQLQGIPVTATGASFVRDRVVIDVVASSVKK
jgi:hypothetical protein